MLPPPNPLRGVGAGPSSKRWGATSLSPLALISPLSLLFISLSTLIFLISRISLYLSLSLSLFCLSTLSLYIYYQSSLSLSLSDSFTVSPQKQIVCHIAVRLWQVPQQTQMCTQEHSEAAAAEADGDIRFFVPGGGSRPLCGACRPSASCRTAA